MERLKLKEKFQLLEEKLLQPDIRKSINDLNTIIDDTFIEIGSSGCIYNKQQILNILPAAPSVNMAIMDFEAKLLAEGIVQTIYRAVRQSDEMTEYSLRSSIWLLKNEKWCIVFHQGTPITNQ